MKRSMIGAFGAIGVLAAATLLPTVSVTTAQATPANGFTGVTVAKGTFGPMFSHIHVPKTWDELFVTRGTSDLYVQDNTWQPGERRARTPTPDRASSSSPRVP